MPYNSNDRTPKTLNSFSLSAFARQFSKFVQLSSIMKGFHP